MLIYLEVIKDNTYLLSIIGTDFFWSSSSLVQKPENIRTNLQNSQVPYAGFETAAVHKMAQREFGKRAIDIYSSYRSPGNIRVFAEVSIKSIKEQYLFSLIYISS